MPYTRLQAIRKLATMVAANEFPELDSNQLGELIDAHRRWRPWTANTYYEVGDMIVPTVPNGRMYQCIIAGNSGNTEPPFPRIGYFMGQTFFETEQQTPYEGFGITWQDNGFTQQETYDIRAAAREGWMWKASNVANLANTDDGKMSIQVHIIQENCLQMAAKYRSFGIL